MARRRALSGRAFRQPQSEAEPQPGGRREILDRLGFEYRKPEVIPRHLDENKVANPSEGSPYISSRRIARISIPSRDCGR